MTNTNDKNNNAEEPKTKIDAEAFANKVANTAGRYARKGVDFIGKAINPDNLRKIGSKAKSVVDSVSEGWVAAGVEDHTEAEEAQAREKLDAAAAKVTEKMTEAVNKAKSKIDEAKDKVLTDDDADVIDVKEEIVEDPAVTKDEADTELK